MNKYYLAYGSNLSMAQMAQRCPDAVYVGTAELKDYQLLFKGSQSGSYLTVEPKKGSTVPVLVWRISERDEHYLDRYEGCPSFYYKKMIRVEIQPFIGEKVDCQHFFRQIFLGYFSDIVQAFDTLRKNVCGDDYTSLHNPIVLSSVLPAYGMFHSIQILFL